LYIEVQKNVISIIILAILYISLIRQINWKEYLNRIFLHLIWFNIVCLVLDSVIIFLDGNTSAISNIILNVSVGLYYGAAPFVALLWLLYVDLTMFGDKNRILKLSIMPSVLILINLVFVILSYQNDFLFNISGQNVFSRGSYFFIIVVLSAIILFYTMIHIYINKSVIRKQEYVALMTFALPPLISGILLIFFKEINFVWNSMVISHILVYIYIQSRITNTDFLTGLYNRREYEFNINQLKNNKSKKVELSGIMIDINDFKKINDEYGHKLGDEALIAASKMIKASIRKQDYVFRVGGDEFVVMIFSEEHNVINDVIKRINHKSDEFNQSSEFPFKLSYSMGTGIFDENEHKDINNFLDQLDFMMYDQKRAYKEQLKT
jgi:diguanylate cyclase (GGDEF)-like protein